MTRPLTPRERVAAFLKERDEACGVIDADDAERDESAGLILTALASGSGDHSGGVTDMIGSGDHAELTLNAKAAQTWALGIYENREQAKRRSKFIDSDLPATVLALLAENAALRSDADKLAEVSEQCSRWIAAHDEQSERATEAERKLAEADGLMIELADAPQPKDTGGRFFRAMSSINAYVAQLNASKEAERG